MMRQFLMVASLVGLLMYAGFASEGEPASATVGERAGTAGFVLLERALVDAGADLEAVVITAWIPVSEKAIGAQVPRLLGWAEGDQTPEGESRSLKWHTQDGRDYLSLKWALTGQAMNGWESKLEMVRRAIKVGGSGVNVTVQLEGKSSRTDLLATLYEAVRAAGATEHQVWADGPAASIAGKVGRLPASPFGINFQAAVRRDAQRGGIRIWVAWPALLQEY